MKYNLKLVSLIYRPITTTKSLQGRSLNCKKHEFASSLVARRKCPQQACVINRNLPQSYKFLLSSAYFIRY